MPVNDPGTFTGIGALLSAALAFLRGETRFASLGRRVDAVEAEFHAQTATFMPRELCDERVRRIEQAQATVAGEVKQLRSDVAAGFREVKTLIRQNGGAGP